MASFWRCIILSITSDEDDVILKACVEEEQVNMATLLDSLSSYFYPHLPVVQYLRVLIPFTLFKTKVLATTNATSS